MNEEEKISVVKKDYLIIVNAREKQWLEKTISYEQLVVLAFGVYEDDFSTLYSVAYKGGEDKKEGIMIKGDSIRVKDKMIINVSTTSRS